MWIIVRMHVEVCVGFTCLRVRFGTESRLKFSGKSTSTSSLTYLTQLKLQYTKSERGTRVWINSTVPALVSKMSYNHVSLCWIERNINMYHSGKWWFILDSGVFLPLSVCTGSFEHQWPPQLLVIQQVMLLVPLLVLWVAFQSFLFYYFVCLFLLFV